MLVNPSSSSGTMEVKRSDSDSDAASFLRDSSPTNNTTSSNSTSVDIIIIGGGGGNGGGLFYCGYVSSIFGRSVFPDFAKRYESGYDLISHETLLSQQSQQQAQQPLITKNRRLNPTHHDILIFGLHGPCTQSLQEFPGKVLVLNGEPFGGDLTTKLTLAGRQSIGEDLYQIGSTPDGNHTLREYLIGYGIFLRHYYYQQDPQIVSKLTVLANKPINLQTYHAVIYTSSNCVKFRDDAINTIAKIIPIHFGGKCSGTKPRPRNGKYHNVPPHLYQPRSNALANYHQLYNHYKFCFVMENTYPTPIGYISEKIWNAFLGGCIPIYYGSRQDIYRVFNPKAFVFYDIDNPALALDQLYQLSTNDTAYQQMLYQQPILANGNMTIRNHFSYRDEIENGHVKMKIRNMMGV